MVYFSYLKIKKIIYSLLALIICLFNYWNYCIVYDTTIKTETSYKKKPNCDCNVCPRYYDSKHFCRHYTE